MSTSQPDYTEPSPEQREVIELLANYSGSVRVSPAREDGARYIVPTLPSGKDFGEGEWYDLDGVATR